MNKYFSIYIILTLLVITSIICVIVPAGQYIENDFTYIDNNSNIIIETINAPINGFIGINDGTTINYFNNGTMSGVVILSLLIISIFMFTNIVLETKYVDNFLTKHLELINKYKTVFIVLLILFFTFAAFTHGMYETTIPIAVMLFTVFERLGYKKLYVVKIILYSTSIGYMSSTINPFATKLASDLAGVNLNEGFISRIILLIILLIFTIIMLLRDSDKYEIKQNDVTSHSIMVNNYDLLVVMFSFIYMSYSFMPFELPLKLNTYEICLLFITFSIYFGIKYFKSLTTTIDLMIKGVVICIPIIIVLSVSRGIYVLLNNSGVDDTLIYYLTFVLRNINFNLIILILFVVFFLLAIVIPSSSAIAFITIPILSSALALINFDNSLLVTIYQSSIGIVHIFSITSVVVVTLLYLTKTTYRMWIKETYKYVITITLITLVLLLITNYLI